MVRDAPYVRDDESGAAVPSTVASPPGSALSVDLERFFGLSTDLLCVAGFDGYFQQLSPSWSDLLGYTKEELSAVPFMDFVHPEDRQRTIDQFAAQVEAGVRGIEFENRYRAKDGSYRFLRWNATPDAERGLVYAVARCMDQQIEADVVLRTSEALFRSAFDDAVIGMTLTGLDGHIKRVNAVFAGMLGRPAHEIVGVHYSQITHPDDLPANGDVLQKLMRGDLPGFSGHKRYLKPDGTVVETSFSTALVRDSAGQPQQLVTQILDVTEQRAAERRRDALSSMLDGIIDNSQSLVYVKDLDGKYLLANTPFLEAFAVSKNDLIGRDDTFIDPELEPVWRGNDLRAREGAYRVEEWSDGDTGRHWYESVKFPLFNEAGELYATCGVSLDVTELHNQREAAQRSSAFSSAVLAASPDVIHILDADTGCSVYSTRTENGRSVTEPDLLDLADPEDRPRIAATLMAAGDLEDGQVLQMRYRTTTDGETRWHSSRITPFRRESDGRLLEVLCVRRDVTDAVAAENKLSHAALHDPLTDLPNRTLLADRLTNALARSVQKREQVAVLFCDLDGFKRINDSAGHSAGDQVLLLTARRLQDAVRAEGTVARVGGDEFVVLLEAGSCRDDDESAPASAEDVRQRALDVAARIVSALALPLTVDGVEHSVSVSVGVAYAGGSTPGPGAEDALRDADAAMYRAKSLGKDRYEVFESTLRTDLVERGQTEQAIRRALRLLPRRDIPAARPAEAATLDVAYQPVYDSRTNTLVGFEALARLWDATRTPISPDRFIAVAEDTGLIRPLGNYILQRACAQLGDWLPMRPDLTMAVNLSARQAQHPGLVREVMEAVSLSGIAPGHLVLELTETVLLQAARSTISAFRELRDAGIGIAIDDFGTGYASLRYLTELPVSMVKVDRSFTAALPHDQRSLTIVKAVAGLAEDLSLQCVVEGVETEQQRAVLPSGVLLQGWLLGRPALAQDVDMTPAFARSATP